MVWMVFDPIGLAGELGDGAAFERKTLEQLGEAIGFDAAFFVTKTALPTTVNVDAIRLAEATAKGDYEAELAPVKQAAFAARGVAVDTALLGESWVREQSYFREFAAPIGGRHSLIAFLTVRGQSLGGLMLGRTGSTFSEQDIALVESLLPRIAIGRASFAPPWVGGPLRGAAPSAFSKVVASVRGERQLERIDTSDGSIRVRDKGGYREMVAASAAGELVWSRAAIEAPTRSGWFYIDLFHLAAVRARFRNRALFVGSGGAVGVRQFATVYPGMKLDVVELDERVVGLAERWFGLDEIPNVSVSIDDGARFVLRAPSDTWDVVVVDAYGSHLAEGFADRAFFANVRRLLRPGGCLAFNVIGPLLGSSAVQWVERAVRAELSDVQLVPVLDGGEQFSPHAVRNVVILASRE